MIIIAEEEEEEEISTFKDERVERGRLFHRRPRDGNALSDAENCVSRRGGGNAKFPTSSTVESLQSFLRLMNHKGCAKI